MNIKRPFCITFAGCVGSSKTPIANFLSCKFGLPVFNNDAIRTEVIEDLGFLDNDIHIRKRDEIINGILKNKISFICDASQDRDWSIFKKELLKHGYSWFIISLDLSKEKLEELYKRKGYDESLLRLDQLFIDHDKFTKENKEDINLVINDSSFNSRLQLAYSAINLYLKQLI